MILSQQTPKIHKFWLLLLVIGLAGCSLVPGLGDQPSTKSFRVYVEADLGFLIKVPPEWLRQVKPADEPDYLPATRWWIDHDKQQEVFVSLLPKNTSAEEWLKLRWKGLQAVDAIETKEGVTQYTSPVEKRHILVRIYEAPSRRYLAAGSWPLSGTEQKKPLFDAILLSLTPLTTITPDQ